VGAWPRCFFAAGVREAYLTKDALWMRFALQASLFIFVGIVLIFKALFNPPMTVKFSLNHQAAFDGNIEAVKQHLAAGADVNAKDWRGRAPLDFAKRKPELADLLRKHGAKEGN